MENRRLKLALWISRAERYKIREFIAREEGNLSNQMSWSRVLRERTYNQWVDQLLRIANLANKLQNKCRAKAEEYVEGKKMEAIKTLVMLVLTIALIYGLMHSIKTRQENELKTSNEYLYIDGKRMCRGILHFNGRVYSFECEDGMKYRGLQNFVVR